MDIGPEDKSDAGLKQRVFVARLAQYYGALSSSVLAVTVNSALLAALLWHPQKQVALLSWLAVTLAIAIARYLSARGFRRLDDREIEQQARRWYLEVIAGALFSGLTWGAAGYLLFDPQDGYNQSLLAFVVAGMCAGSVVSFSAFFEAAATFLTLALLPFIVRLISEGTGAALSLAFMASLYLLFMIVFSRRLNVTVVTGLEMTYLRSRAEATVQRQAFYDELTGLPNRRLLQDRLSQSLARTRRHQSHAALLFLDLDYFKRVNDSLGHSVGDLLLKEMARRISAILREEDTAARLGGDEFVVLMADLEGDIDDVLLTVRRRGEDLRRAVEAPVSILGNEIHMTGSIGVSMLPEDSDDADDLLKHADTAMYRAKDDGRNTLRFFVNQMQEAIAERLMLERELRLALETCDEFMLYLQPQYTDDGDLCGAELLLRWCHDGAFIPPDRFIPVAEDSGLIYALGDWVIRESCRLAAELRERLGDHEFSLAFNVSPRQFRQRDFSEKVLAAVAAEAVPAGFLELELTEGLLIEDVDDTVEKMRRLRDQGLRFSIDDFGTGYSSLRYLKSLPLDTLKVDQSFVRDVLDDPGDASIVRAIISMAGTLELDVIAEGVETTEIRDFLVAAGCRRFQGYLYSRPLPFDEFLALLPDGTGQYRSDPARTPTGAGPPG